ncbi:tyrosine-type recombinase/integrase [Thiomicrorhabdus sediminis]|uniref:Site-specific integrase n=1 Tax=Thiomicrorhabdus sediminis TaxID=2580412 RepID=A0A4P9K5K7_9GAMM|nr:site-specific integrase [Thiomicrorhabdus sediminis]QCU90259.1 site-specific integrase [Thiomicrorhabdus sediminis]
MLISKSRSGTITPVKTKNSTRFNAQRQYNGIRYSQRFDTLAEAEEWLDDLSYLGATDNNGNPTRKAKAAQVIIDEINLRRKRDSTPTLQECIVIYGNQCELDSAPKYVRQLQQFTKLHNVPINEISRLAFEIELDRIQDERQFKDPTRNRYQAAFSSLFKWLARQREFKQYQLVNPTKDVPRAKDSQGRMLFLTKEQQVDLLNACKNSRWKGLFPLVYLLLLTGARRNEISCLRWENIDFDSGVIYLLKTKNKTDHAIKLPAHALKLLKEWKVSQPLSKWVFQHRTNPRKPMLEWDHLWHQAKIESNMPVGLRVHDLRHTTASTMLAEGFSLEDIRATLNHKSLLMTNRYAHALDIKETVTQRNTDFLKQVM